MSGKQSGNELVRKITVDENGVLKEKWTPCSPADPEGMEMTLMSMDPDSLLVPKVKKHDFMVALTSTKPSVDKDNIARHEKFTQEKGQSGA